MGVRIGVRAGNGRSGLKGGRKGDLWTDDGGFFARPWSRGLHKFWVVVGTKGLGDNGRLMMMLEGLRWW